MKPNKFDAVLALVGGEITCSGDEYIFHNGQTPPTEEQIQSKISELQADYDAKKYQRNRKLEYPAIGDQLDALYHAGAFPKEMADKLKAVKDKYKKPE